MIFSKSGGITRAKCNTGVESNARASSRLGKSLRLEENLEIEVVRGLMRGFSWRTKGIITKIEQKREMRKKRDHFLF